MVCERHVTSLYCRGASWEVQTKLGDSELFDAVILTMPVPQILQLQGDVGNGEMDAANRSCDRLGSCDLLGSCDSLGSCSQSGASPEDTLGPSHFVPLTLTS